MANYNVYSMAVQPDGKILAGGNFTTLGGQARNSIGRLNPDGTLDTGFNPEISRAVSCLALQADGKILVGGTFTNIGGQTRNYIGRLNPNGTLDTGFNPRAGGTVSSMVVQADGKILVVSSYTNLDGQMRNSIGRLNPDGTMDNGFNPEVIGIGSPAPISSLAMQMDGKILVGGSFTNINGQTRNHIGRINPDGSLDTGFNPGANGTVCSMAVQADEKILVGGYFTTLGGLAHYGIGRLNPDGTLDIGFFRLGLNYRNYPSYVYSLAVQTDGKILVGGRIPPDYNRMLNHIVRLNPNGTRDMGFNSVVSSFSYYYSSVESLAVQSDGKILVGGYFTNLCGQVRNGIGRLDATDPATQSLNYDGSTITWLRGGTSPEVYRTLFEWSSDGLSWTCLGEGARVPGGWQCTNATMPMDVSIRARGFVTGSRNGSNWFVEDYWGLPAWITQPVSRTNNIGTTVILSAPAGGTPPLSYQWFKGNVAITNDVHISGVTTAWLTLSNVFGVDAGDYHLVVSNAHGALTSVVATVTVNDPEITAQPISQIRECGQSVTFSVAAQGTAPFDYQWWKDGVALLGQTASSLTLTDLGTTDAGTYWVVVNGPYSSATSRLALLTVNRATLDTEFISEANECVYSLALQPDGKILVGGGFTSLGGQTCDRIGRLNPNGRLDIGFNPRADYDVHSLAVQPDGKILVGGIFTSLDGQTRDRIGRLNPDATLDTGFNPGANDYVYSLALQPDGKIVVGGYFTVLGGQVRNRIGRLNRDGTVDTGFNPGANDYVYSLVLQPDGKILVSGSYTNLGGQTRHCIGRLNPDGSLDTAFDPGANSDVYSLALQADGKILVGGSFTNLGGQTRHRIGRLNPDGSLDTAFDPRASSHVYSLAVQADGKILVGGSFTNLGGQTRNCIGRLNPDGTLDTGFNPGADYSVFSLALQADGKILLGGGFTNLCGQVHNNIARLNATDPATQSLDYDGSTITWLRGGTNPEVWRTVCECSQDGLLWTSLGEGTRMPGGWQWTNAAFSTNVTIRTRGFVTGGGFGSGWFVETMGMYRPGSDTGSPGRMVVVYENPLLEAVRETDGQPSLLLYARPGWTCGIEERSTLAPDVPWREVQSVTATNMATPQPLTCTNTQGFFRAVR